jgi:hypothetical protein
VADIFALIEHVRIGARYSEVNYAPQKFLEDIFLIPGQGKTDVLVGWLIKEPNEGHTDLLLL